MESTEGTENAIIINGGGDVVGIGLKRGDGIAHSHANASSTDEGGIVATITKGNGVREVEA